MHKNGEVGEIEYTVWSEVFTCPECSEEIVFSEHALDFETKNVKKDFSCPGCNTLLTKRSLIRYEESYFDEISGRQEKRTKRSPILIVYKVDGKRYEKRPDDNDRELIDKIDAESVGQEFPHYRMMNNESDVDSWGDKWRSGTASFRYVHQLFLKRQLIALESLWRLANKVEDDDVRSFVKFCMEQAIMGMTLLARYVPSHFSQVNQYMTGVYYVASQHAECSPWYILEGKLTRLVKAFSDYDFSERNFVSAGDSSVMTCPDESLDYIFIDPPFGDNLAYAELNFVMESFHSVFTNMKAEAIVSRHQEKDLGAYHGLMRKCFFEFYRPLTLLFSGGRRANLFYFKI